MEHSQTSPEFKSFKAAITAIEKQRLDDLEAILADGLDPNLEFPGQGQTLLLYLLNRVQHELGEHAVDFVRVLIDAGADVNLSGDNFTPALTMASSMKMVKYLVERGALLSSELATLLAYRMQGSQPFLQYLASLGFLICNANYDTKWTGARIL